MSVNKFDLGQQVIHNKTIKYVVGINIWGKDDLRYQLVESPTGTVLNCNDYTKESEIIAFDPTKHQPLVDAMKAVEDEVKKLFGD
jgi:hypothetical protein